MRKSSIVLTIAVFLFLFAGVREARAADAYVPKVLQMEVDGQVTDNGTMVPISVGTPVNVKFYAGDANGDGVVDSQDFNVYTLSTDETVTVSAPALSATNLTIGMSVSAPTTTLPTATDLLATATVVSTAQDVSAVVSFALNYKTPLQSDLGSPSAMLFFYNAVIVPPVPLYTSPMPRKIAFTDMNGNPVTSIRLEGTQTRELNVMVVDVNKDGVIDQNDYIMYGANVWDEVPAYTVTVTDSSAIAKLSPSLLELHYFQIYPVVNYPEFSRKLCTATVHAIQPTNTEIQQTTLSYSVKLGSSSTPVEANLSVTVTPRDDAAGGNDSGGTCNAFGLGALVFLVPVAFFRRKSA